MKVLLVDDEDQLVSTLAERLELRGIHASWVTNGEDAILMVKAREFDVAVLDVKLPKIGGIELKRKLAAIRPNLKFLFMTGHGSQEDFDAGSREAGKDNYLVKPVRIEELIEHLQNLVQAEKKV
uniref:Response regulator n=1 Tax=Desulfatirhabdium butyrativorans TaxID=340467 RepID=A0A7C4RQG3_9BACT